jgi:hypothetical protein
MSLTKLLNEEMRGKQILKIIYEAEKPFNQQEIEILKICIHAIVHDKLDMLHRVLENEGFIKKK